jgi:hypothetical protein
MVLQILASRHGRIASACLAVLVAATPACADDAEFKAVTFVHKLGGSVQRDAFASGQPVVAADLYGTPTTDAGLQQLTGLARLKNLDLSYTRITDKGMKELVRLGQLHALALAGTSVTEAGLKELAALEAIESLDLSSVTLTAAGCKELARCKSLRTLFLSVPPCQPGLTELQEALPLCKITLCTPGASRTKSP